ncbi:MAG: hypothetical protein AB1540_06685 [Bdellovibrionota bacterium]
MKLIWFSYKVRVMEKATKIELLQRSLALKHKLKVHDSLGRPETHEEIAVNSVARWELEDELLAIEELLREARAQHVTEIREKILKSGVKKSQKKWEKASAENEG